MLEAVYRSPSSQTGLIFIGFLLVHDDGALALLVSALDTSY